MKPVSEFTQSVARAAWLLRNRVQQERIKSAVVCGAAKAADSSFVAACLARQLKQAFNMKPLLLRVHAGDSGSEFVPGIDALDVNSAEASKAGGVSAAVQTAICQASTTNDFVLIDAPPVLAGVESLQAIAVSQHVVLTVEFGATQEETVARAVKEIQEAGGVVLGTLLTRQRRIIPRWIDVLLGA